MFPKNLLFLSLLFYLMVFVGCSNSKNPSGPSKDITDYANHYEMVYVADSEICTINSSGSDVTKLTENNDYDHEPIWSPDGEQIAFVSAREGQVDVFLMNKDGTSPNKLTQNPEPSQFPSFSPDGQKIIYNSNAQIFVVNIDGSDNTFVAAGSLNGYNSPWSPNGRSIAYANYSGGDSEILVIDPDGSNQKQLTDNDATDYQPTWSPDGTKIAFVSERDGNLEIYVMNSDGSNQINITNHSAWDNYPTWSPDGTLLLFISDRDGDKEICIINSDGSNQKNLTNDAIESFYLPTWSPDQTRIAFAVDIDQDTSNDSIFILDLETGSKNKLTNGVSTPRWSPVKQLP